MTDQPSDTPDGPPPGEPRQRVVRVRGARRAQLTPAPDTDPSPEDRVPGADDEVRPVKGAPGDDRITRERPPHW